MRTPRAALSKLSNLALRVGANVPHEAIQAQIADVVNYVVQMARNGEARSVSEVIRLRGYDFEAKAFEWEAVE